MKIGDLQFRVKGMFDDSVTGVEIEGVCKRCGTVLTTRTLDTSLLDTKAGVNSLLEHGDKDAQMAAEHECGAGHA